MLFISLSGRTLLNPVGSEIAWLTFIFSVCLGAGDYMAWEFLASAYRTSAYRPETFPIGLAFQPLRDWYSRTTPWPSLFCFCTEEFL